MFGGNAKLEDLQQQIDEIRNYCLKFSADVNKWAEALQTRMNQLEEDKK